MSAVADHMLKQLNDKASIVGDVIHQVNFYKPMRGNMRRPRAGSQVDLNEEEVEREVQKLNEDTDWDDPSLVDF